MSRVRSRMICGDKLLVITLAVVVWLGATSALAKPNSATDYISIRSEYPCGAYGGYKYYVVNTSSDRAIRVTIRITQTTNEVARRQIVETKAYDLEPGDQEYLGCSEMLPGSSGPTYTYAVAGARFLSQSED